MYKASGDTWHISDFAEEKGFALFLRCRCTVSNVTPESSLATVRPCPSCLTSHGHVSCSFAEHSRGGSGMLLVLFNGFFGARGRHGQWEALFPFPSPGPDRHPSLAQSLSPSLRLSLPREPSQLPCSWVSLWLPWLLPMPCLPSSPNTSTRLLLSPNLAPAAGVLPQTWLHK